MQGFPFEVIPSTFEENLDKTAFSHPWQYAVENAKLKAKEVACRIKVFFCLCSMEEINPCACFLCLCRIEKILQQ